MKSKMHLLNLATVLCKFWSGTPFVGLGKIISLLHERVVPKGGWIDWMECGGTRVAVAFHLAAHQKCFGLWKNLKENPHRKIVWRLKSSVLLHLKGNNLCNKWLQGILLTYSYFTLLIWDLYFRDLTLYFTAFFWNQRNIVLYFIDLNWINEI